jgi:Na+-transporting NADH:ubiquinone oxidoreductase subunit NqrC
MDITQIVIIISLVLITTIIVASGVWLIKIFKELKLTLSKTNKILDDAQSITSSVAKPVSSISEFVMGFKNGFSLFNNLFDKKDKKND